MDLDKLTEQQFAVLFGQILDRIKKDPINNFIRAKGFINLDPTPPQEVIFKVIFQKELDPDTIKTVWLETTDKEGRFALEKREMTEYEIYKALTGFEYVPKEALSRAINNLDLVCGRRSGKSLIAAIVLIYFAIIENWKPFLSKTPVASCLVLSHSREFSDELIDLIKTLLEDSPILTRLLDRKKRDTRSAFRLKVPFMENGKIIFSPVQIKVVAASSRRLRGYACPLAIMDEICHWNLDEGMKETDAKILDALSPATAQFGDHSVLLKLSSPGIKAGVLYEEYIKFQKGELPESYVVFKAPTWMMNNNIPEKKFIEKWIVDPDGFRVEYGSEFMDSLSSFIQPESIDKAILKNVRHIAPSEGDVKYWAAIDAAFKADRFTFSLVSISDNRITQHISQTWAGSRKNPVKAFEVASWIRNAVKDYPVDAIHGDQFAHAPLREIFATFGLTLEEFVFTNATKKKIFYNLKSVIHRQQLDLLDIEEQTKELKELVVEQSETGTVRIGHPTGGHDDRAASLAIATFLAVEGQGTGKFEFQAMTAVETYGIPTDVNGVAFKAPSPEMLVASGHLAEAVADNSGLYGRDPDDANRLKRFEDFINAEENEDFSFAFV